jgi:hypothetical protein
MFSRVTEYRFWYSIIGRSSEYRVLVAIPSIKYSVAIILFTVYHILSRNFFFKKWSRAQLLADKSENVNNFLRLVLNIFKHIFEIFTI